MEAVTEAIRAAALLLLRGGEVDPWLVVLAAVRVTGEPGASAALAVAPTSLGEVTTADRDPASTGRAEVLAPARPGSSARVAAASSLQLPELPFERGLRQTREVDDIGAIEAASLAPPTRPEPA
jgi:hypothetical protein